MRKLLLAVKTEWELYEPPEWAPDELRRGFPELTVEVFRDYAEAAPHLPDAEIFVGWSLPAPKLALAKKLRWVHSLMSGVAQFSYPEMAASPVILPNAATVHAAPVAEHAWALILAMARRLPSAVRYQQQKQWAAVDIWRETPRPFELSGLTLGLVGLGAIGSDIARKARAFGMRVVAVRRNPERGSDVADAVYGPDGLPRLLAESDIVVLAAPSTPETRGLIGESELAQMKREALLVNVARGTLVDEAALCRALEEGRLGGAALDVTASEPLPADSPLWRAPNLLLTPHLSSATDRIWRRHIELLRENIRRYLAGEPLLNAVDKSAGY